MGKAPISGRFVGNGLDRSVQFSRCIVISGRLRGRHICRPYKPIRYVHYNIRSRAMYFYCPVGRGDPTPPQKPSPWGEGGALARRMRGKCPEVTPSSVTYGDSFPQRGKPPCGMTRTGISRGLSKAPPGLCLAQRCAALFDSSYGNKKSSSS